MTTRFHSVYIYAETHDLILHLSGIVTSSLVTGNSVVIVATGEHQRQLVDSLVTGGIDIPRYAQQGLYTMLDCEELLATFMVEDMPDADRFGASVPPIVQAAEERSRTASKGVTVFGEMVAVLAARGNHRAALRLEELWNECLDKVPFRLYCGYAKHVLQHESQEAAVCAAHSSVFTHRAANLRGHNPIV
jgi:hypothetical protein